MSLFRKYHDVHYSEDPLFRKWAYYDCQGGGQLKLDLGMDVPTQVSRTWAQGER